MGIQSRGWHEELQLRDTAVAVGVARVFDAGKGYASVARFDEQLR